MNEQTNKADKAPNVPYSSDRPLATPRPADMLEVCQRNFTELTERERGFLDSVKTRLTEGKDLSFAQAKWLTDIHAQFEKDPKEMPNAFITITKGMRGHFAVLMQKSPDGDHEPYNTGISSYSNMIDAAVEGREWAESEGIPFIGHKDLDEAERAELAKLKIKPASAAVSAKP